MEHNLATMRTITHNEQVLALARQQAILRPKDLQDANIPRVVLARLAASGELEKVGRGLYCLADAPISEHESLAQVAIRVPQAVFCLLTALQIHDLTTQLPRELWIAMPRGSHAPRLDYPPLRMIQFSGDAYAEGIEIIQRDQINLRVYCVAKTLVDCFKHRNKIGLDVALEALKEARAQNKLIMDELWHHAKIARVTNVMRPYLEAI
ncbi:MAG TPA: type IV toxin-antitoxin system AbiEi family antitoxin domain-containing protein [Cellvibrio sp.]|nr:type IV toxin-antitoxin system AbiEi family antitoxin domain-containing protein [Cellvibrio sp.]